MVGFALPELVQTVAEQYLVQARVERRKAEAESDPMHRPYFQAENWAETS